VSDYGLDDSNLGGEIVYRVGDFVYCAQVRVTEVFKDDEDEEDNKDMHHHQPTTQMEGTDVYYAGIIRGLFERPSELSIKKGEWGIR